MASVLVIVKPFQKAQSIGAMVCIYKYLSLSIYIYMHVYIYIYICYMFLTKDAGYMCFISSMGQIEFRSPPPSRGGGRHLKQNIRIGHAQTQS